MQLELTQEQVQIATVEYLYILKKNEEEKKYS